MPWPFFLFLLAASGFVSYSFLMVRHERRVRRNRLRYRKELPECELLQQFRGATGEVPDEVKACWNRIGALLHVRPGLLRTTDMIIDFDVRHIGVVGDVFRLEQFILSFEPESIRRVAPIETLGDILRLSLQEG